MPRSCFDGYLTEGCKSCPDWSDGTDGRGIGCATHFPIMWCPHFAAMFAQEEIRKMEEPAEIEIIDYSPGMVIEPKELPEVEIPEDWSI